MLQSRVFLKKYPKSQKKKKKKHKPVVMKTLLSKVIEKVFFSGYFPSTVS